MTARDIEIAVARHFGYRQNLIVPNVSWGWGLRHEADMIVLRPSGLCDEVEIKVSASDIRADARKSVSHWENRRIARVWFAVPEALADRPDIPGAAGVLSVCRWVQDRSEPQGWRKWRKGDTVGVDKVTVIRPAKLRPKESRMLVTEAQRMKLAELGSMRIWDLKDALSRRHARLAAQ